MANEVAILLLLFKMRGTSSDGNIRVELLSALISAQLHLEMAGTPFKGHQRDHWLALVGLFSPEKPWGR